MNLKCSCSLEHSFYDVTSVALNRHANELMGISSSCLLLQKRFSQAPGLGKLITQIPQNIITTVLDHCDDADIYGHDVLDLSSVTTITMSY